MSKTEGLKTYDPTESPNNQTYGYNTLRKNGFDPASSTIQDLTTIVDARKLRLHRENEVRKLHNRI